MAYLGTSSVLVFPSALRTSVGDGKFTSEDNLTGIIRTIAGKDSFYKEIVSGSTVTGYVIVIHGYCFTITGSLPSDATYAHIKLDSSGRLVADSGSTALDSSGYFNGLWFNSTASDSNASYSLLLVAANKLYISASTIDGSVANATNATTATTATKLGSSTVGSATKPIYLNSGTATEGNTYAGGTAVTLNGVSKAGSTASIYAPISNGTLGYILSSQGGTNAPAWVALSSISAGSATTATKLGSSTVGGSGLLVYLNLGAPVAGIKITTGSTAPTSPSNGDIWIHI